MRKGGGGAKQEALGGGEGGVAPRQRSPAKQRSREAGRKKFLKIFPASNLKFTFTPGPAHTLVLTLSWLALHHQPPLLAERLCIR